MKKIILILALGALASVQLGFLGSTVCQAKNIPVEKQSESINSPINNKGGDMQVMKKTLNYEKNIDNYVGVCLPNNVGNVDVIFTNTSTLKVKVEVIVEGNDEAYQKSMLNDLDLKFNLDGNEAEFMPYRGANMLFEKAADYDRKKCNVKLNYLIQIPKSIQNISLSTVNGTINSPVVECGQFKIGVVNGKFISQEIKAQEISLDTTSSDIQVNNQVSCSSMKMNIISGSLQVPKFTGSINGTIINSSFLISNAIITGQSSIEHTGGRLDLGIRSLNKEDNLGINSYDGDVNLRIDKNANCVLNYTDLATSKNGTKVFNNGGSEIDVRLYGGKLTF